jgi:hypothetical protein
VAAAALKSAGDAILVRERSRFVSATSKGPDADVGRVLLEQEGGLFYGPVAFRKREGRADVSGTVASARPGTVIWPLAVVRLEPCSDWPAWSGLCE